MKVALKCRYCNRKEVYLNRDCHLGQPFDYENVLRVNGFFYTAIDSKDETEESAAPYNTSDIEFTSLVEDSPTAVDRLAKDISEHFTRICRLAGGKTLSKKHNPSHVGFSKKIYMCRRCNCICTGDEAVYSHLSQCCPELRRADNSSEPYDLSNGLLVSAFLNLFWC
ncbi:unnamed protein product [Cylicostephanus goldi]|uniref:Uncharacterized protein n=1 Tax=Cylicostephanus goldi TaxID=71465 RepID=A0A3P6SCA2_CYLGO|nr:unnamed protein product [Cylicostephanus goldi]